MSYSLTWIEADGTSTALTEANGVDVRTGAVGLDVPPVDLRTSPRMSADGSTLVRRRRPARQVALPIYFEHASRVRSVIGQAAAFFQGPGTLRYADDVNVRDLLDVYYDGGLAGDDSMERGVGGKWRFAVVSLRALDPWWYGQTETVAVAYTGSEIPFDDASTTFDAAAPFNGGPSTGVTVNGDAEAFPVVTIDGPFTTCQVGLAGGQTFALDAALADGDTITVDTRPGSRGPRRNNGAVDWSLLTAVSRLWTLPVGSSVLYVSATGDGGNSNVELSYRERWLTP